MIGVPSEKWGETIKALVVLAEGAGGHRGRADRVVQGQGGRLQGADLGRVPRRAGPHRDRQAAEVQAARAVLGGPRPPGQLGLLDVQHDLELEQVGAGADRVGALAGVRRDGVAVAPGDERLLVLPLGDDEVAVLALDRAEQLEAQEAGGPVDRVRAVREALLELLVGLRRDGDGVDLHDGHVSSLGGSGRPPLDCPCTRLRRTTRAAVGPHPAADSLQPCPRSRTSSTCCTAGTRPPRPTPGTRSAWCSATRAPRVDKVMFAVDPTLPVAREAADWGADLLVVHHPLFLKPVHGFAATTPKGRTLATLAGAGCALLTAHTNADQAVGGVSEALALALGLTDLEPIVPAPAAPRWTSSRPTSRSRDADALRAALAAAGAGRIGDYDQRVVLDARAGPVPAARRARTPTIGAVGEVETVAEERVEVVLPRGRRGRAWSAALLAAHPYEEPAYDVVELADPGARRDRHRPDRRPCAETTLRRVRRARSPRRCPRPRTAYASPATRTGRYAGWRCAAARATSCSTRCARTDADVYVTSDLRHHPASEFLRAGRARAGRRRALGGRVDLAPGGGGAAARRRWAIRWRPG